MRPSLERERAAGPSTVAIRSLPIIMADEGEPPAPRRRGCIRFVTISDTHSKHVNLELPFGDVLLHTGDFTEQGDPAEVDAFCQWMVEQPHARKIVIAGNHDLTLHGERYEQACIDWGVPRDGCEAERCTQVRAKLAAVPGLEYLCCGATDVQGVKVWGAPWVPSCGGVFTKPRGPALAQVWAQIPTDVDVLLTHGPPRGHGDLCKPRKLGMGWKHVGCTDLYEAVTQRVRPAFHVFGHIHEGYGTTTDGTTTFINAASCTARGQCTQPPVVFDVPLPLLVDQHPAGQQPEREPTMTGAAMPAQCCCFTCLQELGEQAHECRTDV